MKSQILAPVFNTRIIWLKYRKFLNLKFDWRIPFKYYGSEEIRNFLHGTLRYFFYLGGFRVGSGIEDFLWEHRLTYRNDICKHLKFEILYYGDGDKVLSIRKKGTHIELLRSTYNLELAELDEMIKWSGEIKFKFSQKKTRSHKTSQQQINDPCRNYFI
jgi:hypothetical protein